MMHLFPGTTVRWAMLPMSMMAFAGALCLSTGASAENAAQRFLVTKEMVVTAMQYRQLPIQGVQVRLSAPITASSVNPMLDIQTMTMVDAHNAQLRIACRNRTECLPFYVAATWPDVAGAIAVPEGLPQKPGQPQMLTKPAEAPVRAALRPGSTATLLIEDQKIHIRLRVICLEGGLPGDKVRVSTPDHKVSYKAEIVAPNLLKGSF